MSGAGVGDVVLKFMDLAKGRIDALLSVAESRGDVKMVPGWSCSPRTMLEAGFWSAPSGPSCR